MKKLLSIIAIVAFTLNANAQSVVQAPFGPASVTTPSVTSKVTAQPLVINNYVVCATISSVDTNKVLSVSYPAMNQYTNSYAPKVGSILYLSITSDATGSRVISKGTGFTFDNVTLTASKTYLMTFVNTGSTYNLISSTLQN